MSRPVTKEEMLAWKDRWELVNEVQGEEARRLSLEDRFRELASLMATARALNWSGSSEEEDAAARDRWLQLYKAHGVL